MPIGSSSVVPYLTSLLHALQPQTVLDLGCGFGWAAAAVRQWLDGGVQPFKTRIEGVEAFANYKNPAWLLYDALYSFDLRDWLAQDDRRWDLILLLDVLEHFERAEGEALLADLRTRLSPTGRLLVATPAVWFPQSAVHGNDFERHRCLWTAAQLRAAHFEILWDGAPDPWGHAMLVASASVSENHAPREPAATCAQPCAAAHAPLGDRDTQ